MGPHGRARGQEGGGRALYKRGWLQSGVGGCWAVGEQHQQQAGGMRSLVLLFHSFMTFALLNLLAARCSRSVPPHRRVSTAVAWISFPLLPLLWIWSFCFACYQAAATRPAQGQRKSPRRRRRPGEQSKREEKQAKKDKQEQEGKERKERKGKESTEDRAQSKEQSTCGSLRRAGFPLALVLLLRRPVPKREAGLTEGQLGS